MISSLKCIDFKKEYFDEIDESEKNSTFTRNEECKHFEISMKRISENFKFKKYFLIIECKNCNHTLKKILTKNKDNISYYCNKCNMPQICINFNYENIMCMDEESNNLKDEEKNNIKDSYSNRSTGINSQIQDEKKSKIYNTPSSVIQGAMPTKIYSTPENLPQNGENNKAKDKVYSTPGIGSIKTNTNNPPLKEKIYKTLDQKEIDINFQYNNINIKLSLNELESLERQFKSIKEAFKIKKEENICIYENSELVDIKKSPKQLEWSPGMEIEIGIDNNL